LKKAIHLSHSRDIKICQGIREHGIDDPRFAPSGGYMTPDVKNWGAKWDALMG
jgi:hypothetical protein